MVAFVIHTPRCTHPQTFMSNMLQVCGCLLLCKLLHLWPWGGSAPHGKTLPAGFMGLFS